jgi:hypothetical protein
MSKMNELTIAVWIDDHDIFSLVQAHQRTCSSSC